jgi:hypothetical protein
VEWCAQLSKGVCSCLKCQESGQGRPPPLFISPQANRVVIPLSQLLRWQRTRRCSHWTWGGGAPPMVIPSKVRGATPSQPPIFPPLRKIRVVHRHRVVVLALLPLLFGSKGWCHQIGWRCHRWCTIAPGVVYTITNSANPSLLFSWLNPGGHHTRGVLAVTNNQIRPPNNVQNGRNKQSFDTYAFTIDIVPLVLQDYYFAGFIFKYKSKTKQKAQFGKHNAEMRKRNE